MCHARTTRMQRASTRVQKTACRQTIGASLACAFTCACAQFAAYGRLLLDGCAQRSKLVHSYISSMLYLTTVRPLQGPNLPLDDLEALMTGIYASPVGCLCTCAIARHAASHIARRNTTCNMYASHRRENATRHPRGHSRMRMHKIAPSHTHAQSRTHALARRILPQRRIRAHCTCVAQCFCATVGVAGLTTRSFRGSTWRRLQPQSHGPTAAMAERTATRCQRCLSAVGRFVLGACGDYRLHGACRRPWRHSYRMLCERCKHR
jgi:hypothetical protein